ncbi:hypothetical protein D3C86_1614190 [compost metagenome]
MKDCLDLSEIKINSNLWLLFYCFLPLPWERAGVRASGRTNDLQSCYGCSPSP